jgi:hypothetical protein
MHTRCCTASLPFFFPSRPFILRGAMVANQAFFFLPLLFFLLLHSDVTTDSSEITFTIYDRASEDHFFLGTVQIKPALKHDHTVDQWYK